MHPFQAHRAHKVERSRVAARIKGYKTGGKVRAEETSGDESDGEIARDAEHRVARKSMFKGKSAAVHKAGGEVDGKASKHRLDRKVHRASGGKVGKGKTVVNVIIGKGGEQPPMMPPPMMPPKPPMMPPPMPPGPPPGLAGGPPPPGGGMGGPPPGMPPMMPRRRGGRVGVSKAVAPVKLSVGRKLKDAAPMETSKDPGDKMPQNPPGWVQSEKNKTPVQHTDGKTDIPDMGRPKPITYRTGGGVKNASNAVKPAKAGKYPIDDGAGSGAGRLEKAHAVR